MTFNCSNSLGFFEPLSINRSTYGSACSNRNISSYMAHFYRLKSSALLTLLVLFSSGVFASFPQSPTYFIYEWGFGAPGNSFGSAQAACLATQVAGKPTPYIQMFGSEADCWNYEGFNTIGSTSSCPVNSALSNGVCTCNSGYKQYGSTCIASNAPIPPKNSGPSSCNDSGNPINTGTGNKHQSEVDYVGAGSFPLRMERTYNSLAPSLTEWGYGWTGYYDRSIINYQTVSGPLVAAVGYVATVYINRPDGKQYLFTQYAAGGAWSSDPDVTGKLVLLGLDATTNPIGWTYTNENDEVETYNASGALTSITNRAGASQTMTYVTAGISSYVNTVTDPVGRQLAFIYAPSTFNPNISVLTQMTDPNGGVYLYSYTSTGSLSSVTYPDGQTRSYLYGEAANVSATPASGISYTSDLTGLVDENGARFATWQYDQNGLATVSEHAGGVGKVSIAYNADGSTTITDALGTSQTYGFSLVNGVLKKSSSTQPAGSGCAATASAISYDANGNLMSYTDFSGSITNYTFDQTRNLELSRTEGAGTAQARTVTTSWITAYRLPAQVAEPLKLTTYTYDANGNVLTRTEQATADVNGSQGLGAVVTGAPRTWQYTYNNVGQVLTIRGPRTDVSAITTFTYDAYGNLSSVTDAAGQVTTLSNYDKNGHVGTITYPNGFTKTSTYSPRGWTTSVTATPPGQSARVTTYTYDKVGQLIGVVSPDGTTISMTYDAAHRLIGAADTRGNKIAYTLDNNGNLTSTQVLDPQGNLQRSISASYDALNRVQQVSGAPY